MHRKKIAIYVEGQTEQVLINHLILTRWKYTGIKILNIKLQSYQDRPCKVPNFIPGIIDEHTILFLITDVDGVGSLTSAIANRANNQQKNGFEIIGLRDLSAQDFHDLPSNVNKIDKILQSFKIALQRSDSEQSGKIELFFAAMTIEAWLLAFTGAVSKWAKTSEENILKQFSNVNLEEIPSPSRLLEQIGNTARKRDPKSFHEVKSFVSEITDSEIESVYTAKRVPNFNKFWDKLILLSESIESFALN